MTVWCHGVRGGRSSPHVNAGSTTTHFGMPGALSRSSCDQVGVGMPDLVAEDARRSTSTAPSIALA